MPHEDVEFYDVKYAVEVRRHENDEVIQRGKPHSSRRMAERSEDSYNINLNHEEFYTEIVEVVE